MADINRILGIEVKTQWDAFKYLGVPIFKATLKTSNWFPIVQKIKNRINTWGSDWLNPAGKVVLIKAVLSRIPIYQCSILLAPKEIIASIEALLRKFLSKGGKQVEKKLPLVSWNKVSKPMMQGGLQIKNPASQNLAMGAKILWNIVSGKLTWCKTALRKKYFTGSHVRCLDNPPYLEKVQLSSQLC